MALDTPTGLKKPGNDTDPWLVATLTKIDERQQRIRIDVGDLKTWIIEHDTRHRSIDGKMAIIGVGIPIATGFIVWLITTLVGG